MHKNFKIEHPVLEVKTINSGRINDTYEIVTEQGSYILQRINTNVFTKPQQLMENMFTVCEHIRQKETKLKSLEVVKTNDDQLYFENEEGFFRMYKFIPNSVAHNKATPTLLYHAGVAFGEFIELLSDLDSSSIHEIIKDFHNTQSRYDQFLCAVKADAKDRACIAQEEIEFIIKNNNWYKSEVLSGLPLRVVHNDTKLNNVLMDNKTDEPVCVIDLDTVMQGYSVFDFGDAVRYGCNKISEDDVNYKKAGIDDNSLVEYTKGFAKSLKSITPKEKELLLDGALIMTLEVGLRFLGDYLNGDVYFKVTGEHENLMRARVQIHLAMDILNRYDELKQLIADQFN